MIPNQSRRRAMLVVFVLVAVASCTSDDSAANTSTAPGATADEPPAASTAPSEPDETTAPPITAEAPPTESETEPDSAANGPLPAAEAFADTGPIRLTLPYVPPIALPDLSVLNDTGQRIEEQLGDSLGVGTGLDVVSAECVAAGGELDYQGAGEQGSVFDVASDGSGTYTDDNGSTDITVTVNADGSGTYSDTSAGIDIEIVVNADGSGTYADESSSTSVSVIVNADGSGTYRDGSSSTDVTIEISSDGSGTYADDSSSTDIELTVAPDGTGRYVDNSAATELTLETFADESFVFVDVSSSTDIELVVESSGAGSYRDNSAATDLSIVVDDAGNGVFTDASSGEGFGFVTEIGILDPAVLVAGPRPTFAVADRFPPLDTLATLEPPCVTVIRLGAEVLFDFDSDQLRPEAFPVIDELAAALIETGASIEVHGHTDSIGTNEYNQDLSERRAASFTDALVERGVAGDIVAIGFGEERPVAPNTKPDGTDDPVARQLNRRVEVVVLDD